MKQVFLGLTMGILLGGLSTHGRAAERATPQPRVKYRKSKEINLEKLLIEGQLRRKQISVVTGDSPDGTDGLLRLREDFLDRVAMDAGEGVK